VGAFPGADSPANGNRFLQTQHLRYIAPSSARTPGSRKLKLRREARTLKGKSLCSLRRAVTAFNACDDDGRITCVLLHMQNAAEMLLKAILVQRRVMVFDLNKQTSIGFEKCVNLATQHAKLTQEEAGLLRAVDALRDAEQHWMIVVPEDVLYLHARGFVTTFDDLLKRTLGDTLAEHLPARVLPISTHPPVSFDLLVDREFSQVRDLLRPGKRRRDEARGRIRTLLAMESHVAEGVDISEADIDRIEKAVRGGKARGDVFPRLGSLDTQIAGTGASISVRFTKKMGEGAPVRIIAADDPTEAAAVREVDLQKRFYLPPTQLAKKLKLTPPKSHALRKQLGIDADPQCMHTFTFGKSKHPMFSDNAFTRMRDAVAAANASMASSAAPQSSATEIAPPA
jgi:hypothetical protein